MDAGALLGLSALMSFVAFGIVAWLHVWPRLRVLPRHEALAILVAPHMFRFVGLSFLIPGVVSPALPREFALPAAYGDIWGTIDFLHAIYQAQFGTHVSPWSVRSSLLHPDRGRARAPDLAFPDLPTAPPVAGILMPLNLSCSQPVRSSGGGSESSCPPGGTRRGYRALSRSAWGRPPRP
jgi:hypothetical protein